ncbi:calcium-dependent mitochondrial ATP-magnesium/phosphate carrier protein 3 [Syzygium oleosum]|uniref:calcium-dependent mitochondrial ATP-magnesium/phosphate carrier protein 3 n=1 Tax=Syzygium oleosum TaxID=219896 RepID=UPI0011D18385|nr:calcium-dependent mitochondrial ATP-magnesium/phosphate carrier protein 3 [Syzygium oleosum]
MVSANDPIESLFNTIQAFRGALSPLESGIRRAARDIESCWPGSNSKRRGSNGVELIAQFDGCDRSGKFQIGVLKRKGAQSVVSDEKKKGFSIKVPIKNIVGAFAQNLGGRDGLDGRKGGKERDVDKGRDGDESCANCLQFAVHFSFLANSFVQAFPSPFKGSKKRLQKHLDEEKGGCDVKCKASLSELRGRESKRRHVRAAEKDKDVGVNKEDKHMPLESIECFLGFILDQLAQNLHKFDQVVQQEFEGDGSKASPAVDPPEQFSHLRAVASIWEGRKADVNGFLGNLRFARVGGVPPSLVGVASSVKEETDDGVANGSRDESNSGTSAQKLAGGLLSIPLSNVERLKSTLSTVSLTELIELVPHIGRPSKEYPDKKKLFSVQDFFRYTESEGRRFFEELDRDGDGQVTLEDLEIAVRKRKLPQRYAREFMRRTRSHLFSKSFGWKQFLSLMEQREPTILRAYTSLCLSKSGTLQKSEILESLKHAGLPANEDNADAMMRFLDADKRGSIAYGHFKNFMLLLPSDRLQDDPRNVWFEAATVVPVAPPVEIPAGSVLKSALAGGLSCALSTSLMHPVDTIKTRVQASTLSFPDIIAKLPQIGVRGVYRGSIPAILGQFSSHGLRTGIFEASKLLLINVAPNLPDIQVQSLASFCSTFLGTAVRIPCEVLKQRLQAGIFDNVGEAIVGTWQHDGPKGFFRGTGATLCREVPFYVAGMGLYAESKKLVQHLLGRELEPWETIVVGALSGGLAAVTTTPFDVIKTRMMTAPQGRPVSMTMVAFSILRREGPLGLFKGAVPRFFWIAPLGAMNFAGYELARKAMDKNEEVAATNALSQKKLTNSG